MVKTILEQMLEETFQGKGFAFSHRYFPESDSCFADHMFYRFAPRLTSWALSYGVLRQDSSQKVITDTIDRLLSDEQHGPEVLQIYFQWQQHGQDSPAAFLDDHDFFLERPPLFSLTIPSSVDSAVFTSPALDDRHYRDSKKQYIFGQDFEEKKLPSIDALKKQVTQQEYVPKRFVNAIVTFLGS